MGSLWVERAAMVQNMPIALFRSLVYLLHDEKKGKDVLVGPTNFVTQAMPGIF